MVKKEGKPRGWYFLGSESECKHELKEPFFKHFRLPVKIIKLNPEEHRHAKTLEDWKGHIVTHAIVLKRGSEK